MIRGYPSAVFNRDRGSYGILRARIRTDIAGFSRMPVDHRLSSFNQHPNVIDRVKE